MRLHDRRSIAHDALPTFQFAEPEVGICLHALQLVEQLAHLILEFLDMTGQHSHLRFDTTEAFGVGGLNGDEGRLLLQLLQAAQPAGGACRRCCGQPEAQQARDVHQPFLHAAQSQVARADQPLGRAHYPTTNIAQISSAKI
ncbi:MAG: hypothetical protein ACTSP2_03935 [Alphaproteobacteria bacterium]